MPKARTEDAAAKARKRHFKRWLDNIGKDYNKLSNEEKNQTLDYLIDISPSSQLFHLSAKLRVLLKRDFLAMLPMETAFHLLGYLDADTLRNCCLVSHKWNEVVNSCTSTWKRCCTLVGIKSKFLEDQKDALVCKTLYLKICARLKSLHNGQAFTTTTLWGHNNRVMAIHYKDGFIATGSDDRSVIFWNAEMEGPLNMVTNVHTVADVKFTDTHVVTASFDSTAAIWECETGTLVRKFQGHVAAVFTVDFNEDVDVLVTGSADGTVKVWTMWKGDQPELLRNLHQHGSAWVQQVCVYWNKTSDHYHILSRDSTCIQFWKLQKTSHTILDRGTLKTLSGHLVAGLQVVGPHVCYSILDEFNICYIMEQSLDDGNFLVKHKCQEVSRDWTVQAFLGCGQKFCVFLMVIGEDPKIYVIETETEDVVAVIPFPRHYRESSQRNSTFCVCGRDWLDGFDGKNDQGVAFAVILKNNAILLYKWS